MENAHIWGVIWERILPVVRVESVQVAAVLSSTMYSIVKPMLEKDWYFSVPAGQTIHKFSPKKLICESQPPLLHSIQALKFNHKFNSPVVAFPPNLTYLEFDSRDFNHPLDHLPATLTHLTFYSASYFTHPLNNLPQSITHLVLGKHFAEPLILPPNLQTLITPRRSLTMDKPIPPSVTELDFPFPPLPLPPALRKASFHPWTQPSLEVLPSTLTHLTLEAVTRPLDWFPPLLTSLEVTGVGFVDELLKVLPQLPLATLKLGNDGPLYEEPLDALPPTLTKLSLLNGFNGSMDNLPYGIKHLSLYGGFTKPIGHLPSSLTCLDISSYFNQPLDNLPPSLTKLDLDSDIFQQSLDNLPSSLTSLGVGYHYNQPLDHLPASLTFLRCSYSYTQPLDHLPPNLLRLDISYNSKFDHLFDHLPASLIELDLPGDYNQPLINLPESLLILRFGFYCFQAYCSKVHLPPRTVVWLEFTKISRAKFFADIRLRNGNTKEDKMTAKKEKEVHRAVRRQQHPAKTRSNKSRKKSTNKEGK